MKGMLFKEPLFRQILAGNKVETRRIVKPPSKIFNYGFTSILDKEDFTLNMSVPDGYENYQAKPRYKKGEVVYLKEPYVYREGHNQYFYKFDYFLHGDLVHSEPYAHSGWKNKLFMPGKAARYFIRIDNVRIEMLQDITRTSIRNEGLMCPEELKSDDLDYNYRQWYHDEWVKLWDKINGKTFPWSSNPIVFAYDFSLL